MAYSDAAEVARDGKPLLGQTGAVTQQISPPSAIASSQPLSTTARTRIRRNADRAVADRSTLHAILRAAVVCHLGVLRAGSPVVVPMAFAFDPDGPDAGGSLYVHGSVAAGALLDAPDSDVCVTVTHVDGLVLARSAFHHSMNYRSAVILGRGRVVRDPDERSRALDAIVDHAVPGRSGTLRASTRKELAATAVVAVSMAEASVKVRSGPPVDDEADLDGATWAGVLPLRVVATSPEPDEDTAHLEVPDDVRRRFDDLR